jgi:hypothetical protein
MKIATLVSLFLIAISAIFGLASWRDYRKAGQQWTVVASIHRRTALIFGLIGLTLLLFTLLPKR